MRAGTEPKVSIVVVNWNGRDVIRPCLESLQQLTYPRLEIVVVDNASTDGSIEAIEASPGVRLVRNHENLGFPRACNRGIAETGGEYVLLLNNDTVADRPRVLDTTVAFMEEHEDAGALGVRLRNEDGSLQISCAYFPDLAAEVRNSLPARLVLGPGSPRWYTEADHERTRPVDWVMGAFLLLRRAALEEAGAFDERIFMYADDYDLCYRLRLKGWRTYFLASTSITHRFDWSKTFADDERAVEVDRAERSILAKHRGRTYARAFALFVVADRWSKLVVAILLGRRETARKLRAELRARIRALA
ncbi:MAG: glycosyltransferase family 2 protein [Actinomycetota bacterium]